MTENNATGYDYYALGRDRPVRVSFNENGHRNGAQILDPQTGQFVWKASMMFVVLESPYAEEITKEEFDRMVTKIREFI